MKVLGLSPVEDAHPGALRERCSPFAASVGVGAVMLAMCLLATSAATAGLARHIDEKGTIHFTNAPEDPRDPESGRRVGHLFSFACSLNATAPPEPGSRSTSKR